MATPTLAPTPHPWWQWYSLISKSVSTKNYTDYPFYQASRFGKQWNSITRSELFVIERTDWYRNMQLSLTKFTTTHNTQLMQFIGEVKTGMYFSQKGEYLVTNLAFVISLYLWSFRPQTLGAGYRVVNGWGALGLSLQGRTDLYLGS